MILAMASAATSVSTLLLISRTSNDEMLLSAPAISLKLLKLKLLLLSLKSFTAKYIFNTFAISRAKFSDIQLALFRLSSFSDKILFKACKTGMMDDPKWLLPSQTYSSKLFVLTADAKSSYYCLSQVLEYLKFHLRQL